MRNNPDASLQDRSGPNGGSLVGPQMAAPVEVAARETIYALSSGAGRAGVAVVRLSGAGAGSALTALVWRLPPPREATLVRLRDPDAGGTIDRGLVLWFPGPESFTGEDVAELHLHGGRAVLAAVFRALERIPGLRPAEAGEFTHRAFDNGKLDLSAAEGLADLIDAETEAQRRQAVRQLGGALGRLTEDWRKTLLAALAHLEATIDFADEELAPDAEAPTIAERAIHQILCLKEQITLYIDDCHRGERLRDGLAVTIVGAPNVGKSSLLNALARRDAAIVSEVAGTTRDVIEVHLDLGGYPVILADTAGLHGGKPVDDPHAAVEAEGMRRARVCAAAADLTVAVFDSRQVQDPDLETLAPETLALIDANTVVVLNKRDLVADDGPDYLGGRPTVAVSAKTGAGMAALEAVLSHEAASRLGSDSGSPLFTRVRHRQALMDCVAALERAAAAPLAELAAEDVRLALRSLGRIAGRVDVEDILDVIFRDFCIGK